MLREFWTEFHAHIDDTKDLRVTQVLDALNEALAPLVFPVREDGSNPRICPTCGTGNLSLKLGKYGAFVGCSNYPDCNFTRQLSNDQTTEGDAALSNEPKDLGKDPHTEEPITLRTGRFGPYVQRGDGKEAKRASLPKGWAVDSIDHEKALALLSLPRDIGQHPESGKMISAGIGRYGPFLLHDGGYANLETVEDVFSIGLNRAVTVIAEKAAKGPGRGRGTPAALKSLGDHPDGGPVTVRDGKYGPYVNWGKVNATLPKDKVPTEVTLEEALEMITAKAGASGKKKAPAKKAPAKKAPAKKGDRCQEGDNHESQETRSRQGEEGLTLANPPRKSGSAKPKSVKPESGAGEDRPAFRRGDLPRPGNHPAVSRREPGSRLQARHRQGLRPEGRHPRRVEGPASRARR